MARATLCNAAGARSSLASSLAVESWKGERDATRFGPQCVQPLRDARSNSYAGAAVTSEDCLYLNVWAKPGVRKAPVIVYIHGGAFYSGAGSFPIYDGEAVARRGAVFVNLNYRVGPLGFLALPELSAESPTRTSGNYGLLDQIAALQWVKRNIARFGGDPDNVTIAGQSAGSMSVLMLQASPLAKGLFHRAVGMSGAMITPAIPLPSHDEAERAGSALREVWKARTLADLRALPADRLVVPRVPGGPSTGPSLDGHVIPASIPDIFAAGRQSDVPLLLGFTRDEALGGIGPVTGLADYAAKAQARYGDRAAEILANYPATTDAEARAQARLADRDATVVAGMAKWAEMQSRFGKSAVYTYKFSRPHSYVPGITFSDLDPVTAGAYHTSEVPFWFGTLESLNTFRATRQWTVADRQMSDAMLAALIGFARTGSPATMDLPFPRFDCADPLLLDMGATVGVARWPDAKRLHLFHGGCQDIR